MKKLVSILICAIIASSSFAALPTGVYAAAKDVSLKKSSATLKIKKKNGKTVFGSTKIAVKKAKGVKITNKKFKIKNKKIAKVSKSGKVTAKKQGKTKITVTVNYKLNKKSYKSKLKFSLTVKDLRTSAKTTPAKSAPVNAPVATVPAQTSLPQTTAPATETELATTEPATEERPSTIPAEATQEPTTTAIATAAEETTQETGVTESVEDTTSPVVTTEEVTTATPVETTEEVITTEPVETTEEVVTTEAVETTEEIITTEPVETTEEVVTTEAIETSEAVTETVATEAVEETTEYLPEEVTVDPQGGNDNKDETEPETEPDTEPDTGELIEGFDHAKLSHFSNKLYEMCSDGYYDNMVISPISVYMAMTMLYNFGDDNVKREVKELVEMSDSDIARTSQIMDDFVREYTNYNYVTMEDEVVGKIDLVNSVWFDKNLVTDPKAVAEFVDKTQSELFSAPFADDNIKANEDIRKYVSDKTNGLIDRNFKISPATLVTLINTLYFKEGWDIEMEELNTVTKPFYSNNGEDDIEFNIGTYNFGQAQGTDNADYFFITTKHNYKIYFVVPKDGFSLEDVMTTENLDKVLSDVTYNGTDENGDLHYTRCIFPSFSIDTDLSLRGIFEGNNYFENTFNMFFSDITPNDPLAVSDIIHQAVLDVAKEGIEGAAVTIIEMEGGCAPDDDETPRPKIFYHDFDVNKNFGFIITNYSNDVLFEGQVANPNS